MADDETPNTSTLPGEHHTSSASDDQGGKQLLAASAAHPPPKSSSPAPHEAAEHGASGTKGPRTGNVENVDSIPTAGGERLGDKHWGESKIVPDDPKTQQGGAGVQDRSASAEVRENTAKNTGDATSGPQGHGHGGHDGGEKEGLMDKVKDKLNMGKK